MFDSLECDNKNIYRKNIDDHIEFTVENIKILNEIQRKINKINNLVNVIKKNIFSGKVRTLSCMYENMRFNEQNDYKRPIVVKFRKRNLSLPNFVEGRLNVVQIDNDFDTTTTTAATTKNNEDDVKVDETGQLSVILPFSYPLIIVFFCNRSMKKS